MKLVRSPWASALERFSIRGFLLMLMLTSTGLVLSSVWKLHAVRTGSFRIDGPLRTRTLEGERVAAVGYDEVELLKRDLRELIRSENQEMLHQLFERIRVAPSTPYDDGPKVPRSDFVVSSNRSALGGNRSLAYVKREVPFVKEISRQFWDRDWRLVIEEDVKVRDYLTEFENACRSYDSLDKILERRALERVDDTTLLCPCVPATLSKYWLLVRLFGSLYVFYGRVGKW